MNCPHCSAANPEHAASCSRCGTPMPISDAVTMEVVDTSALAVGSDFGTRYRIESLLGQGGMARVCKAFDKQLDRTVAIKVVRPGVMGSEEALQRFKQELLLASKVSHKNILRIHDMGEAGDVKFTELPWRAALHGIRSPSLLGRSNPSPRPPILEDACEGRSQI
jgi:serine/threonine protein kinase